MNACWSDWTYFEIPSYRVPRDIRDAGEEAVAVARRCLHLPPVTIHWMRRLPTKGRGRERRLWAWARWRRWGTPETLEGWKQKIVRDQFERSLIQTDQPIWGLARRTHPGDIWLVTRTYDPYHNPEQVWQTALHECRHLDQYRFLPPVDTVDVPPLPPLPRVERVLASLHLPDPDWLARLPAQQRHAETRRLDDAAVALVRQAEADQPSEEREAYHTDMEMFLTWLRECQHRQRVYEARQAGQAVAMDGDAERFAQAMWLSLRGMADLIIWDLKGDLKVRTAGADWEWWLRRKRAARQAARADQAA